MLLDNAPNIRRHTQNEDHVDAGSAVAADLGDLDTQLGVQGLQLRKLAQAMIAGANAFPSQDLVVLS